MKTARRIPLATQALQLPNLITYARVLAIPAVLVMMQLDSPRNAFIASLIFAGASLTDALDGYLARRFNQISLIGKFLDPLADKLIVMGALLMLVHLGRVSPWIALLILSREIVVTGLRTIAAGEGLVIAARDLGKQKTAFQMVGIWALLVHYPYALLDLFPDRVSFHRVGTYLLYISVLFSLVSAAEYFGAFIRAAAKNDLATPPTPAAPPPTVPPASAHGAPVRTEPPGTSA